MLQEIIKKADIKEDIKPYTVYNIDNKKYKIYLTKVRKPLILPQRKNLNKKSSIKSEHKIQNIQNNYYNKTINNTQNINNNIEIKKSIISEIFNSIIFVIKYVMTILIYFFTIFKFKKNGIRK